MRKGSLYECVIAEARNLNGPLWQWERHYCQRDMPRQTKDIQSCNVKKSICVCAISVESRNCQQLWGHASRFSFFTCSFFHPAVDNPEDPETLFIFHPQASSYLLQSASGFRSPGSHFQVCTDRNLLPISMCNLYL